MDLIHEAEMEARKKVAAAEERAREIKEGADEEAQKIIEDAEKSAYSAARRINEEFEQKKFDIERKSKKKTDRFIKKFEDLAQPNIKATVENVVRLILEEE